MTDTADENVEQLVSSQQETQLSGWRDYYELCKPRVVMLMILTSIIGMFLAVPGMLPWDILIFGNLGIALVSASGAAVNHIIDHKIDAVMARTQKRPIVQGKIDLTKAAWFAFALSLSGMIILLVFTNTLTAWLTLASFIGYAFIYTGYLKRATPQNIVIGGVAGAMPPLLGWVAVTGTLDPHAWLLVLIIFAWTPPHFWALAIHRESEYAKVEIPMLPVTHGAKFTKLQILLYTVIMIVVSLLPFVTKMSNWLYLLGALILGAGFLYWVLVLMKGKNPRAAMDTFRYSIVYLMGLFVILLADHYLLPISH